MQITRSSTLVETYDPTMATATKMSKSNRFTSKTTTFLYSCLMSLHDIEVKMSNFMN